MDKDANAGLGGGARSSSVACFTVHSSRWVAGTLEFLGSKLCVPSLCSVVEMDDV